jgi:hypothetical protein
MQTNAWQRFRSTLESEWRPSATKHPLLEHPELLFRPLGWTPDEWQLGVLRSSASQQLVCIPRQVGKSLVAAAKGAIIALTRPRALVTIISRSQDQAAEVLRKVKEFHAAYCEEKQFRQQSWKPRSVRQIEAAQHEKDSQSTALVSNSVMSVELGNGGRIKSMPCSANTTVGFTNDLLILDEASRIPDQVYMPLRPTLAKARSLGKGQLLVLSTPNGKRGWFWEAWDKATKAEAAGQKSGWERTTIKVEDCPRISQEFLEDELRDMGRRWFAQEYECHVPETLVLLADGTRRPVASLIVGDALTYLGDQDDIGSCRVTKVVSTGMKKVIEVRTECGTTLTATENHPVATSKGWSELLAASDIHYVRPTGYTKDPDESLARLVGHNLGDGTIAERDGEFGCAWYAKYDYDLEPLAQDVRNTGVLCYHPTMKVKLSDGPPVRRHSADSWQVQLFGQNAKKMVEAGAAIGKKKYQDFPIPRWILNGSVKVQKEFVAALFGAEGYTPKGRSGKSCEFTGLVMYKATKELGSMFFGQLVDLINSFGIDAKLSVSEDKKIGWAFMVEVIRTKSNVKKFFDTIGFRYAREKERLAFEWSAYYAACWEEVIERKERVLRVKTPFNSWRQVGLILGMNSSVAHGVATEPITEGSRVPPSFQNFAEWVEERRAPGGLYIKTTRTEEVGERETINLEVDSSDHSYLLGDGLNNHNCVFGDAIDQVFRADDIQRAFDAAIVRRGLPDCVEV